MQTPLQLTFRHMAHSDTLAAHVERRAAKLEHLFDRLVSCHVVIEPAGHHGHDDRFHVSINLNAPGHEIVASHAPRSERTPETALETADRAFDEAERQLEDWVRRQRDLRRVAAPLEVL